MLHVAVFCMSFLLPLCAESSSGAPGPAAAQAASRANNVGVAYMNQQFTEKALAKFEEARRADASAVIPLVNEGVAYLYLRKLPEAEETLQKATVLDPASVRAWYSLGVAAFGGGDQDAALTDFQHAAALDAHDADTHYYIGSILSSQKKFDQAIAEFNLALDVNPLHASAQFGLARALQREGKTDEARQHIKRFQEITDSKIGMLLSASYGEQGRYATVQDMLASPKHAGAMIPVTFVAGASGPAIESVQTGTKHAFGGGVCVLDLQGKGSPGMIAVAHGSGLEAYDVAANGALEPLAADATGLRAEGDGVSCAVGDFDNDGMPDVALALTDRVLLFRNLGHGKFVDVTEKVGLKPLNKPAGIAFVDFDHDGDLDLYVTGSPTAAGASVLWRNNGNSTFTEWTKPTNLAGSGDTVGAVLSDINNDRAVDLVVSGSKGAPQIYQNQREGAFKQLTLYADASLAPSRGLAVADFNKDGLMDVAVTHSGAPGLSLWRNVDGTRFERIALDLPGVTSAWGLTPIDVDNDGWIDLAVLVETAGGTELRVLRNEDGMHFTDVSEALGLRKLKLADARSVVAADLNHDGAADLLIGRTNAEPMVLLNAGGNRNHSLRIDLAGLADNKSGIGVKVEVFSDGDWQKFEIPGASGYMGQGAMELIAGLGSSEGADVVRLLWPTGVPQDELDIAASKPLALTELDRRGSSCPVLFAWDGTKYVFVSDVIGAGVVGHWMSPTSRNQPDSDEWTKIDGDLLRARDGHLSVRFGEPMEEINYIDHLRMVAVDHPSNTEVYPDEKFLTEPPFASGATMVASPSTHLPAGAWDDHGQDALAVLSKRDHRYLRDFTNLSYAGFANDHTLTLDLGAWSPQNPVRLFLHGYVEYFSASSMYAAWQAGIAPQPPSVEAQMADGTWKVIIADMGFPAGLPRTIVVDLTGKLPVGARRIRLKTNLQIYWDQVLVDNGPDASATARTTELPLTSAHLAFRGYPKQIDLETPGDLTYDYQSISMTGPFGWQRGSYTRYGDVTPLLTARDNHFVIFGSGEDIDAEFSDSVLPALPQGWKRDYFFYADGFVKDMDFYEALPFTVAEMPFHEMSSYPYTSRERFPDDADSLAYRLEWNDRTETGDRTQRFQFDYKHIVSEPILNLP
jgi:Tfp pilus assembly protein PilF